MKLRKKAGKEYRNRLTTVAVKMEDFPKVFPLLKIESASFDLIFCSYGLYYSNNPTATLQEALKWLKLNGKMAIVGPYRANNWPLFKLLMECGVEIPPFVLYTSQDFMENSCNTLGDRAFSQAYNTYHGE